MINSLYIICAKNANNLGKYRLVVLPPFYFRKENGRQLALYISSRTCEVAVSRPNDTGWGVWPPSPAPIINCGLKPAGQCDMEFLLQLYLYALAILAARCATSVENCELRNAPTSIYTLHTAIELGTRIYYEVA